MLSAQRALRNDGTRNFAMAFGERKTFSWASDGFGGLSILCDQVTGVCPGYYLLTAVGFGLGSRLLR